MRLLLSSLIAKKIFTQNLQNLLLNPFTLCSFLFLLSLNAHAESIYPQEDPVALTQSVLTDQSQINSLAQKDSKVNQANQLANQAVKGNKEDREELNQITAEVFKSLASSTGGDAVKMQELLLKALKNPESFKGTLSPETQKRIEALATKVDSRSTASESASQKQTKP